MSMALLMCPQGHLGTGRKSLTYRTYSFLDPRIYPMHIFWDFALETKKTPTLRREVTLGRDRQENRIS